MTTFEKFGLIPSLQTTLADEHFVTPTDIQKRALPLLLKGKSLVGVAETGSGKTLVYILTALQHLKALENEGQPVTKDRSPRSVIMVPTRELGEQVARQFKVFTHKTRLWVRSVLGGTTLEIAKKNIEGSFDILVATPGRLIKLLDRGLLHLSDVRILIFDEVDQMLDQGFLPDSKRIAAACPSTKQLILFSATVSAGVQELMKSLFAGAEVVRTQGSHQVVAGLTTRNQAVSDSDRLNALQCLLAQPTEGGTMIFTNTREQCDILATELAKAKCETVVYRGSMDKLERRANLKAFRSGAIKVLISTDLGSRGLDVDHVERVINYHMPYQVDQYLHRAGRTARAGRSGLIVNLVGERDVSLVEKLRGLENNKENNNENNKGAGGGHAKASEKHR